MINLKQKIKISAFPHHLFWSYKKDAELNYSIVIEHVFLYGDIPDIKKVFRIFTKVQIRQVLEKIKITGRNKKRTYFIEEIFLNN